MNFELTPEEAKALFNYLEHEYIPYSDLLLLELVRKLMKYVSESEEQKDVVPNSEQL